VADIIKLRNLRQLKDIDLLLIILVVHEIVAPRKRTGKLLKLCRTLPKGRDLSQQQKGKGSHPHGKHPSRKVNTRMRSRRVINGI